MIKNKESITMNVAERAKAEIARCQFLLEVIKEEWRSGNISEDDYAKYLRHLRDVASKIMII